MNSERTRLGLKAAKDGDRREARRMFAAIVRDEPDDLMGWWHLANVTDDSEQKAQCLRQVLRIDPSHTAARAMLTTVEQQVAKPTPAHGFKRPVAEADATGEVSRPSLDHLPPVKAPARPDYRILLAGAAVAGVVLVTILAVVVVTWPSKAPQPTATVAPAHTLSLTVQECVTNSTSSATLTFVNQSGHAVTLFQGPSGQETNLGSLATGAQLAIETAPGVQVRFSARADDASLSGGATIEVPAGNSCTVPIK